MSAYAELHCASNFSFLRGASHPEELVERALALEYAALAITDECSFAGSVRAHLALAELRADDAAARDFRLVHGTEIQLSDGPRLVLLAQTRAGRRPRAATGSRAPTSRRIRSGLPTRSRC
jgi:error-prone DNA polymerase